MSRKRRQPSLPTTFLEQDGPTSQQWAKGQYVDVLQVDPEGKEKPKATGAVRNVAGTPLDRYLARKMISARQFDAGDRFREDWHFAGLTARVVQSYAPKVNSSGRADAGYAMPAAERQLYARQRVRGAQKQLGRLAKPLIAVAIEELNAEDLGKTAGYKQPGQARACGMTMLRLGLDMLADHYGL